MRRQFLLAFLFLLLVLPFVFSSYGPARYMVEKTWVFEEKDGKEIGGVDFAGFFLVNSSYQNITIISYTPDVVLEERGDGVLTVSYKGFMGRTGELHVSAFVDVLYEPALTSDPPFEFKQLSHTNLTKVNSEMFVQAKQLTDTGSALYTIRNISEFVYSYLTYDHSYFGVILPAESAYAERKGVCAEYSHLFISLSRAVGLDTQYVLGYVIENGTISQDHAWAVLHIPQYGYLPLDPTYLEAGTLDNSHIAMVYSADNNGALEYITTFANVKFNSTINVSTIWSKNLTTSPIIANCTFNSSDYVVNVYLSNPTSKYKFLAYTFGIANGIGESERKLALLSPNGETVFTHKINASAFEAGYSYLVPVLVRVNDHDICEDFIIEVGSFSPQNFTNDNQIVVGNTSPPSDYFDYEGPFFCCLPVAFFVVPLVYTFFKRAR